MTRIYLSQINPANFRSYGSGPGIGIHPDAGLVLLCGMNGLGKTALFDAIEWTLTGRVQHIEHYGGASGSLTRRGAANNSHAVTLRFSQNGDTGEQNIIKRTSDKPPLTAGHPNIASFLKSPAWPHQINDIGAYLRLTHLLAQSSSQRFLNQGEEQQWNMLKSPSGVEGLEKIRIFLGDTKARNAFGRQIQKLTDACERADNNLTSYRYLISRQKELFALANAGAALSSDQIMERIETLGKALSEIDPAIVVECKGMGSTGSGSAPAAMLASYASLIKTALAKYNDSLHSLHDADSIVEKWQSLEIRQTQLNTQLESARSETVSLTRTYDETAATIESSRNAFNATSEKVEQRTQYLATLSKLCEAFRSLGALSPQLAASNQRLAALAENIEKSQEQLDKYATQFRQREEMVSRQLQLQKNQEQLDTLQARYQQYQAAVKSAAAARLKRDEILKQQKKLLRKKDDLSQLAQQQKHIIQLLQNELTNQQHAADKLGTAIAEIVQHLTSADRICPLCAHEHPPGHLLVATQAAMERNKAGNAGITDRLALSQKQLRETREQLESVARQETEIVQHLNSLDSIIGQEHQLLKALLTDPGLAGTAFGNIESQLRNDKTLLQDRIQALGVELAALPALHDIVEQRAAAQVALTNYARESEEVEKQRNALLEQQIRLRAELDNQSSLRAAIGDNMASFETARDKAARELDADKTAQAKARGLLDKASQQYQIAKDALAKAHADESSLLKEKELLAETRDAARQSWGKLILSELPQTAALQQRRTQIRQTIIQLETQLAHVGDLVSGLEAWDRQAELQRTQIELNALLKETGIEQSGNAETMLGARKEQADASLQHAINVSEQAASIASELTERADKFNATALNPLMDCVRAFRTILSPFDYDYQLTPSVTHARTRMRQTMYETILGSDKRREFDPKAGLSEGQAAAYGLGVLFAASVQYPWSRWPALLMDDPLQHNDLIHASAFIDVIRGFIIDQKYQVFLSTHDTDEADFIARKCMRFRIPVTRIELIGLGPEGVRYQVQLP